MRLDFPIHWVVRGCSKKTKTLTRWIHSGYLSSGLVADKWLHPMQQSIASRWKKCTRCNDRVNWKVLGRKLELCAVVSSFHHIFKSRESVHNEEIITHTSNYTTSPVPTRSQNANHQKRCHNWQTHRWRWRLLLGGDSDNSGWSDGVRSGLELSS